MPRQRGARNAPAVGRRRSARISSREGSSVGSSLGHHVGITANLNETMSFFNDDSGEVSTSGDDTLVINFGVLAAPTARIDSDHEEENQPAVKRPKLEPVEKDATANVSSLAAEDGDCCTICFLRVHADRRTSVECIERWIRVEKNNKCPTCKAPAKLADIRALFGKLSSGDNSEIAHMKDQLKFLTSEKAKLEQKLTDTENELTKTLRAYEEFCKLHTSTIVNVTKAKLIVAKGKVVPYSPTSQGRAVSYSKLGNYIVVGCELPGKTSTLTHGFFMLSFKPNITPHRFSAHTCPIRALQTSPFDERHVASVADDQMLMIRDVTSPTVNVPQQKFKLPTSALCVCWIADNELVVGMKNGRVLKYSRIETGFEDLTEGDGTASIISMNYDINHRTLLITSGRQISAYRHGHMIKLVDSGEQNRFQSFFYDAESQCFLVTMLPTKTDPSILKLYKVEFGSPLTVCQIGEHRTGIVKNTRNVTNILWKGPDNDLYTAYYDEDRGTTVILNWGQQNDQRDSKRSATLSFSIKKSPDYEVITDLLYVTRERASSQGTADSPPLHQLFLIARNKFASHFVKYD
ncbi:E3 ubiquitin-protein ligase RFWD3 [Aphelenchoides besseyi]|nr:E3 ubiquitin-protein ligase RFWD3 [Aphelenchoides besseyi]